jgi:hypothetical protein
MRLPLIAQADLAPEQRPIYEDMRAGIENSFQGFTSIAGNGSLRNISPMLVEIRRALEEASTAFQSCTKARLHTSGGARSGRDLC